MSSVTLYVQGAQDQALTVCAALLKVDGLAALKTGVFYIALEEEQEGVMAIQATPQCLLNVFPS